MMHIIKYAVQCIAFFFWKKKYLQAKSSASYLWHYEEVGFWAKKKIQSFGFATKRFLNHWFKKHTSLTSIKL